MKKFHLKMKIYSLSCRCVTQKTNKISNQTILFPQKY